MKDKTHNYDFYVCTSRDVHSNQIVNLCHSNRFQFMFLSLASW